MLNHSWNQTRIVAEIWSSAASLTLGSFFCSLFVVCLWRLCECKLIQFGIILIFSLGFWFFVFVTPRFILCAFICWDVSSHSEAWEWLFSCCLYIIIIISYTSTAQFQVLDSYCGCCGLLCTLQSVCFLCAGLTEDFRTWCCLFNLCVYCCCVCYMLCFCSFCFHHFEGVRWRYDGFFWWHILLLFSMIFAHIFSRCIISLCVFFSLQFLWPVPQYMQTM